MRHIPRFLVHVFPARDEESPGLLVIYFVIIRNQKVQGNR